MNAKKTKPGLFQARMLRAVSLHLGAFLSIAAAAADFTDANWISMGGIPGANGVVRAVARDNAGNLYIGGEFTMVGDVYATNIARWNGNSWTNLGSGMDSTVLALAALGSEVYAAGSFTTAGGNTARYVAKWDGSGWSSLGSGTDAPVAALLAVGNTLFVGGSFTTAGGIAANSVAKWDGSFWTSLGLGLEGGVSALAESGGDLYAGGAFTNANGNAANHVAVWDGSAWWPLGSGVDEAVYALAVRGTDLYAGGAFANAGGSAASYIARWDGGNWSALAGGVNTWVTALAVSDGDVYAGGYFTKAANHTGSEIPAIGIVRWSGTNWSAVGSGFGDYSIAAPPYSSYAVHALIAVNDALYAGGGFTTAGGSSALRVAKWNRSDWIALTRGVNDVVNALAVSGSDLYGAGTFTTAGIKAAKRIAKWNGSSWEALDSGMDASVNALAASGSDVYAGGAFTTAGNSAANYVAKWDGNSWSAVGAGMKGGVSFIPGDQYSPVVNALVVSGSSMYVGGSFTTVTNTDGGLVTANSVAKWDGTNWSALGSGMDIRVPIPPPWIPPWQIPPVYPSVRALAVLGTDLYAGGRFTTAGGVVATNIARWDGTNWSALGLGLNGRVFSLAVSGSNLYVGGNFTMAGEGAATNIAKWDGTAWSPLGSGVNFTVSALCAWGGDVFVGGRFTSAGGLGADNIAKWNGNSWSSFGSGLGGGAFGPPVLALAIWRGDLMAAGAFTTAGGKVSAYIVRADLPDPPELLIHRFGQNVMVSWPSPDTAGFALEQVGGLATAESWVTNAAPVADDGTNKSVTVPATNSPQFFRLRRP